MTKLAQCPNCGHAVEVPGKSNDMRLAKFTVRLRVYDMQSSSRDNDPFEDSAKGYPPDHIGIDVIAGVRNTLTECVSALTAYHGEVLHGLTGEYLDKKERGIRPTLSRTNGRGRITLEYDTKESFSDGQRPPRYRARIDLHRINGPQQETEHDRPLQHPQ